MKRFSAIKTSIAILSVLAFLVIAGPVRADWIDDLKPVVNWCDVVDISMKFSNDHEEYEGVVTLKTENGSCMEYRVSDNVVVEQRECGGEWQAFVKK